MTTNANAGPHTAPVAYSYVRFSSRKQAQGDSQRRQTELAAAYCSRRGWALSEQTYEDLGVSAFRGKNALVGNLGEFLKAVQSGAVQSGSALIVESLDRVTRQGIDEGYDVVKRILKAGVRLVTLTPEREFDASATKSLSKGALEIQLILERAAEESERKSERISAVWVGKRKAASEGKGVLVAGTVPAWIEKRGGKLRLIPERAKVVRRIFALAATGYGRSRIVQTLKEEGVPSFSGAATWPSCAIGFILTDRRALGEYQPRKRSRILDGELLPNYYPAAVSEREWLAARAGMTQRRRNRVTTGTVKVWTKEEDDAVRQLSVGVAARRTGRSRAAVYQRRLYLRRRDLGLPKTQARQSNKHNFVNVFSGLVRNARQPHDAYNVVTRMDCNGPNKALLNRTGAEGNAACWLFQLVPFERAVLKTLREIDPRDVLPQADDNAERNEAALLQDQLDGVKAELADADTYMTEHGFSATIGKRVTTLEAKQAELGAKLLDVKARDAQPVDRAWKEYGTLLDAMDKAPDPTAARLRLRACLRRIVTEIRLLVVPRNPYRLAEAQIWFAGGQRHRTILIAYRSPRYNGKGTRQEGRWGCRPITHPDDGLPLSAEDLRDQDQARDVLGYLEAYPQDMIDKLLAEGEQL